MTDQQPTYRHATPADLGPISEIGQLLNALHHSAWPEIFAPASGPQRDEAHWRQSLETASAAAFVAERDNEVLGFITINVVDEQHTLLQPVRYARINSVCVVETARGQGIGRGLMRHAEQWAYGQGATDIRLTVLTCNAAAQGLYEELGYAPRSLSMGKSLEP